jgi:hypothetical protein
MQNTIEIALQEMEGKNKTAIENLYLHSFLNSVNGN